MVTALTDADLHTAADFFERVRPDYTVTQLNIRRHKIQDGAVLARFSRALRAETLGSCYNPLGARGLLAFARAECIAPSLKTLYAFVSTQTGIKISREVLRTQQHSLFGEV